MVPIIQLRLYYLSVPYNKTTSGPSHLCIKFNLMSEVRSQHKRGPYQILHLKTFAFISKDNTNELRLSSEMVCKTKTTLHVDPN